MFVFLTKGNISSVKIDWMKIEQNRIDYLPDEHRLSKKKAEDSIILRLFSMYILFDMVLWLS